MNARTLICYILIKMMINRQRATSPYCNNNSNSNINSNDNRNEITNRQIFTFPMKYHFDYKISPERARARTRDSAPQMKLYDMQCRQLLWFIRTVLIQCAFSTQWIVLWFVGVVVIIISLFFCFCFYFLCFFCVFFSFGFFRVCVCA